MGWYDRSEMVQVDWISLNGVNCYWIIWAVEESERERRKTQDPSWPTAKAFSVFEFFSVVFISFQNKTSLASTFALANN